jgi:hypothetical protein
MGGHETLLLLGALSETPGAVESRAVADGRSACAISAGGAEAMGRVKHDLNEDAVLVMDAGDSVLLAAADAHYGNTASHFLLQQIAAHVSPDVRNLYELGDAIEALEPGRIDRDDPSETTLIVVVMQRHTRRGFGLSFGDSSCVLLPLDDEPRVLNEKQPGFVTLARPVSLGRRWAHTFRFMAASGDLLLVYTDGVDECHYRQPRTSVRPRHLAQVLAETGNDPKRYAEGLAALALSGVDGYPGGEDNLAIAVAVA